MANIWYVEQLTIIRENTYIVFTMSRYTQTQTVQRHGLPLVNLKVL